MTNIVITGFLLVTFFAESAFNMALKMTSAMTLIPYLLVAAYGFKLAATGETYESGSSARRVDWVRGGIATVYALLMILAGGARFLLLSALIYAPGTILYVMARREQDLGLFTAAERVVFGVVIAGAAVAVYALATGTLSI